MPAGLLCQNIKAHLIQLLDPVPMTDTNSPISIVSLKHTWKVSFVRTDNSTLSAKRYFHKELHLGCCSSSRSASGSKGIILHYSCKYVQPQTLNVWHMHCLNRTRKIKQWTFITNIFLKQIKIYKSKCYFNFLYPVVQRSYETEEPDKL